MEKNKKDPEGSWKYCVCQDCGYSQEHKAGERCGDIKCPECGKPLTGSDTKPKEKKSLELKKQQLENGIVERRAFPLTEIRIEERDGKIPKITGHAAVFGKLSEVLGFYREKIRAGAFKKTITEADVRALFNHDPNYVLGRNKSGTLSLEEDDIGLKIGIDPPDTTWARDLVTTIQRKDVDQMSFAFLPVIQEWDESDPKEPIRELIEVKLFDVSPVTFPAYPDTDVGVRSILEKAKIDFTLLSRAVGKDTYGMLLSPEEIAVVRSTIEILQEIPGPAQEDHPEGPAEKVGRFRLQNLKRRLELVEKSL